MPAIGIQVSAGFQLLEYQLLTDKMIEWRLLECKQHKYKLVLGDLPSVGSSYATPIGML